MSALIIQRLAPTRMQTSTCVHQRVQGVQLMHGAEYNPLQRALRMQCSGSTQSAPSPDAAWPNTHPSLKTLTASLTLIHVWTGCVWHFLRASVLPILLSAAAVATWGVAFASQAIATTLPPTLRFASIAASRPSMFDEFNRWAIYNMQKFFSQSILAKIAAVAAFAVPLVLVFGYWYRRTSGKPMEDSMFQVYSILQDAPGATACDEPDRKSGFVLNLVWVIGLFSYALVLGIVSDDVAQTAEGFKRGNTSVVESGHTVVLNVNNTTEDMLRQWAMAQRERGQSNPIVLLADQPKADLDSIVNNVRAETKMDIMARTGVPYNVDDLRLVSADKANTVIVMNPENNDEEHGPDSRVQPSSATLVSLAAMGDSDARILLQMPCRDGPVADYKRDVLQSATNLHTDKAGQAKVVKVDALQSLRDAKTQCAVSPGVAGFFREIFNYSADSVEVYCEQFQNINGMTFREARHHFKDATPLGFSHNGVVHANPADNVTLAEGDWIFGIAQEKRAFSMSKPIVPNTKPWTLPQHAPDARAHNIIVAAFAPPSDETLSCLGGSMPHKGSLTIICPEPVKMPSGRFRKRYIKGHPGTAALLQEAGLDSADSLLLSGMHEWGNSEADIQVLCSMAQLSDLMTTSPRRQPLHVVAEARGPLLEEFAERLKMLQKRRSATEHWQLLTTDVLPTEELVAGVIAQSGMQPEVSGVLKVRYRNVSRARRAPGPRPYVYGRPRVYTSEAHCRFVGRVLPCIVSTDVCIAWPCIAKTGPLTRKRLPCARFKGLKAGSRFHHSYIYSYINQRDKIMNICTLQSLLIDRPIDTMVTILELVVQAMLAVAAVDFANAAGWRSCRPRNCGPFGITCGKTSFACIDGSSCKKVLNGGVFGDKICVDTKFPHIANSKCLSTSGKVAKCSLTCDDSALCSDFNPPPPPRSPPSGPSPRQVCQEACTDIVCSCTDGDPEDRGTCLDDAGPECAGEYSECFADCP
eukprot:jgi/Ulvmu1/5629/UM023_0168.1